MVTTPVILSRPPSAYGSRFLIGNFAPGLLSVPELRSLSAAGLLLIGSVWLTNALLIIIVLLPVLESSFIL
jgi:hypothetical protein